MRSNSLFHMIQMIFLLGNFGELRLGRESLFLFSTFESTCGSGCAQESFFVRRQNERKERQPKTTACAHERNLSWRIPLNTTWVAGTSQSTLPPCRRSNSEGGRTLSQPRNSGVLSISTPTLARPVVAGKLVDVSLLLWPGGSRTVWFSLTTSLPPFQRGQSTGLCFVSWTCRQVGCC